LYELLNHRAGSVGCSDPGCIHNATGRVQGCSFDSSQCDGYLRLILIENGGWIMIAPGLMTNCEEPGKMVGSFIELKSKITDRIYIGCQPKPTASRDIIYNDSVHHTLVASAAVHVTQSSVGGSDICIMCSSGQVCYSTMTILSSAGTIDPHITYCQVYSTV
jgi:hypothetical protein